MHPNAAVAALLLVLTAFPIRAADWIWVEGESAVEKMVTKNSWYETVPTAAFSGGAFLAHFDDAKPGEASYAFDAPSASDYALWLRANPNESKLSFQLNGGDWKPIVTTNVLQKFTLAGWDMRFLGWIDAGPVHLLAGPNTLRLRFEGSPKQHGMLDCFLLTREPFQPFGIAKPDEVARLRAARDADAAKWFEFNPPGNSPSADSLIDLRSLNEKSAGDQGRILARGGQFIHAKSAEPLRFWAVNGPPRDLKGDALKACARRLAQYGVNLVRAHGAVFDEQTGELRPARVEHLVEVVEAMKAEGIYTHLSIYFPLWFKPKADLPWLEGYDGTKHPFAALMFNEGFQRQWEGWWRAVLTAKTSAGTRLLDDPALFGVEVQNEDSFFFWTFNEGNIPDPQLRILERQFGDWLTKKHGSLGKAFAAWGSAPLKRDNEAAGRAAFRGLYDVFTRKTARDRDTSAFLLEAQTGFYQRAVTFFRNLGYDGLVTPSNWTTANGEIFGPLERFSYTVGDFLDRHGYFGCRNGGLFSEWSIRDGHTYVDRSALRFEAEEPGAPRQFIHPVIDIEYDGKPSMISETTWCRPNRFRPEAPLFLAAYGALQESDAIVHFALDGADWSVKPGFWMQPWTLMAPSQMGQFPAAALIYRKGLLKPGDVLADITLNVDDLMNLKGTPLPQDAAFDELRLKDVPAGTDVKPGQRIDPLIHFAGRTCVTFSQSAATVKLADLNQLIDRGHSRVRSSTGELELDYAKGVLTINAPSAQGASGNLKAAGPIELRDVAIESPLDNVHVVLVSLDNRPLRTSKRMLLQVMSEERNSGWKAIPQGGVNLIESIGRNPWQIRKIEGKVRLARPDATQLRVAALDGAGRSVETLRADRATLVLRPETLFYLIHAAD